jgi:hypothetical protein
LPAELVVSEYLSPGCKDFMKTGGVEYQTAAVMRNLQIIPK